MWEEMGEKMAAKEMQEKMREDIWEEMGAEEMWENAPGVSGHLVWSRQDE